MVGFMELIKHEVIKEFSDRHFWDAATSVGGGRRVSPWRRGLKLSGESTVEKITLDGVSGLRVTLSATVHDVLYYMSPIYCQDIINSVSNQLNRLYLKFLKRNPGYDGKVSIYGHSLGSVLSYDILCHQDNLSSPFPMDATYIKQTSKEENHPSGSNQSSTYNSSTNLENSSLINDSQDMVVPNNEDKMISQPSVVVCGEELAEPSVTADLEEPSIMAMDSNQPNDSSSLNESVHEQVCDSSDMFSQEKMAWMKISTQTIGELFDDKSNKDEECKLLREEIASLKARIAELECQCGGNEEGHKAIPKQPFYERVPTGQDVAPRNYTPYIKYTKLEFKVDTFFAVGSPLGVFLALRNIRLGIGKGQDYWGEENISEEMPSCRQIFNIFHPFDPVAYRIEPLICKEYIGTRPVIIPYHKGGKRLHIGLQDFAEDLAARSQAMMDHLQSVRVKVLTVCQSKNRNDLEDEVENSQENDERSYGSIMLERLTGSEDGRVDHMLQDKTFEHAYISAIGAHTNYWRDYDTALFILKHLYRDIPEEPSSSEEANGGSSKNENGSTGWTDQREAADEELPLTFAERVVVKNFSRKAKKIMQS
ncbi:phospholipase SGR2-like [Vitis riparia]|uniref:phospholipase SGR2-like n=1 Tax=Vitis riparia TaxID=96939 RepID=UPI00155AE6CD|nr:phospholipase SGR2-like [Vitis riparia]